MRKAPHRPAGILPIKSNNIIRKPNELSLRPGKKTTGTHNIRQIFVRLHCTVSPR